MPVRNSSAFATMSSGSMSAVRAAGLLVCTAIAAGVLSAMAIRLFATRPIPDHRTGKRSCRAIQTNVAV